MKPTYINLTFENFGETTEEQKSKSVDMFNKVSCVLEKEWNLTFPVTIIVVITSNEVFREDSTEKDPASWKYCFLLRDQPDNKVYINVDLFNALPNETEIMIKHETAHIVVGQLVSDHSKYRMSHFLEEGTAGLDNATERLVSKMKRENIKNLPDPLTLLTLQDIKNLGGDTNKEPFIDQLGYLILFSFVDFLIQKNGREKIIAVYKALDNTTDLLPAYEKNCHKSLTKEASEWKILVTR